MATTTIHGRTWCRATGEPVTTESAVCVFDPESGEEGYAGISWTRTGAHLCGPVVKLDWVYDSLGAEDGEMKITVLDRDPKFA